MNCFGGRAKDGGGVTGVRGGYASATYSSGMETGGGADGWAVGIAGRGGGGVIG